MSKRTKAKQLILGNPTDGQFGTTNTPNVENTDNPTEAFDKVITILDRLAPEPSADLSTRVLSIDNIYQGRECNLSLSAGINYTYIIDDFTPIANLDGEFADGDTGTLSALVNGSTEGSRILTSSDDSGVYGNLTILTDFDPYPVAPGTGFWKSLTANMTSLSPLAADNTEHTYAMTHSDTGTTNLNFKVDTVPLTPNVNLSLDPLNVKAGFNITFNSGVPTLSDGDLLECDFNIINGVSRFYHSTRIATITGDEILNLNVADPVSIPAPSGTMTVNEDVAVLDNVFNRDLDVNFTGFNVKNASSIIINHKRTDLIPTERIYVDTISDESIRVRSGQGLYPSFGLTDAEYGEPYTALISQEILGTGSVVEELQMLGGNFVYPNEDFTNNYPISGPDYTGLTGTRYVTMCIGSITNKSSVTFTINGAVGINEEVLGSIVTNNFECTVIVNGATGWLDANSKYFMGDPSVNGEACYDVAGSPNDGITRRCTFGTQILTGDVYVRIGLPSGSTKSFNNITLH